MVFEVCEKGGALYSCRRSRFGKTAQLALIAELAALYSVARAVQS